MVLVWGITVDGQHWWKLKPNKTLEWVPLHEALSYLVDDTTWSEHQERIEVNIFDSAKFDQLVSVEFREHLSRGEVESRGIKGSFEKQKDRVTEPIPAKFWISAFFQPYAEIDMKDDKRGAATRGGGGPSYRGIILRRDQLELAWPPKKKRRKWSNLIPNSTAC